MLSEEPDLEVFSPSMMPALEADDDIFYTAAKDRVGSNYSYNYRKSQSHKEEVVPQVLLPKDDDGYSPSLLKNRPKKLWFLYNQLFFPQMVPLKQIDKEDVFEMDPYLTGKSSLSGSIL